LGIIPKTALPLLSEVTSLPVFCAFAAFSTTGFDQHTSLVFNPVVPETSIEDCLAALGDRVDAELDTHLEAAVHTLLEGSVYNSVSDFHNRLCVFHVKTGVN